jgi:LysM repeat protein
VNCSSPYTVKKGDWVWDIGRSCNIHPNSIIAANNLYYPYTIYPGDVLILPDNAPPFPGP